MLLAFNPQKLFSLCRIKLPGAQPRTSRPGGIILGSGASRDVGGVLSGSGKRVVPQPKRRSNFLLAVALLRLKSIKQRFVGSGFQYFLFQRPLIRQILFPLPF